MSENTSRSHQATAVTRRAPWSARLLASSGYVEAAKITMLLHGGIGFTWEHDAHLYYRNAVTGNVLFGGPTAQQDRVASKLGV